MLKNIFRIVVMGVVGISAAVLFFANDARAAFSPIGVSVFAPVQFPPEDFTVTGARINLLLGRHRSVYGFDLGAGGSITEQNLAGIQVSGLFNYNQGNTTVIGLQLGGIANVNTNKTKIYGLQVSAGVNANIAETTLVGLNVGLINNSPHMTVGGAQIGLYNKAGNVYGFQIGLINDAEMLHGLQIGLVNLNRRGLFAFAPILNVGF
jgi:hypothetical protein